MTWDQTISNTKGKQVFFGNGYEKLNKYRTHVRNEEKAQSEQWQANEEREKKIIPFTPLGSSIWTLNSHFE